MENYIPGNVGTEQGGTHFYPDELMDRRWGAFYLARALNVQPCFGCSVSFSDVSASDWFGPYMEALYRGGYLDGYSPGLFGPNEYASVAMFSKALLRANYPFNPPPEGTYWDFDPASQLTLVTRAGAAAMLAYNMHLPVDPPSVYLQFDFPENADAGFDFGFEVYRKYEFDTDWTRMYVADPPEQGMEEASDFGMFYDKTIADTPNWGGHFFYYRVVLFNRNGDRSSPADISVYF